jgi:hypothetical protein
MPILWELSLVRNPGAVQALLTLAGAGGILATPKLSLG